MNLQRIWHSLVWATAPLALLVSAGDALAVASYATVTDNYCTTFNQTKPIANNCNDCHVANRSTRVDPQWTWYQATPKGASAQMQNFCVNSAPNGTITQPVAGTSVVAGTAVSLAATGTDQDGNAITYVWKFTGGVADVAGQNASVTFPSAGSYTITLVATDSKGAADATPATQTITVTAPTANLAPNGTITTPASNTTVTQGTAVSFAGSGTDPDGNTPLTYNWNFGGGAANSTAQNPTATFTTVGTYTVSFTVTDAKGLADPTPATQTITVTAPTANLAPNGTITTPASNTTVTQGTAVSFAGSGTDPDGNTPLTYNWNFGGGATNSTAQNPAATFTTVGTYTVSFTVTDAKGLADPTPATLTITVGAPTPTGCHDDDKDGFSPEGGICGPADCNDHNAAVNPGARESCGDGIDNDCDGKRDAADSECNGTDCVWRLLQPPVPVIITRASWDDDDRRLLVEGEKAPAGTGVNLFNADSGALIDTTVTSTDGRWRFRLSGLGVVPCRVRVEIAGQSATKSVRDAPSGCSGGTASLVITTASWNREELRVSGTGAASRATVTLRNAATGRVLATTRATQSGSWSFEVEEPSLVPCTVKVESGTASATRPVSNAPRRCSR